MQPENDSNINIAAVRSASSRSTVSPASTLRARSIKLSAALAKHLSASSSSEGIKYERTRFMLFFAHPSELFGEGEPCGNFSPRALSKASTRPLLSRASTTFTPFFFIWVENASQAGEPHVGLAPPLTNHFPRTLLGRSSPHRLHL